MNSASMIDRWQDQWAKELSRDMKRQSYAANLNENLFLGYLRSKTSEEFRNGDGSELEDVGNRPAKMRALASSSALAVNFFDAWRDTDKAALARALGLDPQIAELGFEYKAKNYPVKPRSPNLDLILQLADAKQVAVESKFTEPYRSSDGYSSISARYFPQGEHFWRQARLAGAQEVADRLRPEWIHLDVPQLLKHLLGLANDPAKLDTLLYLWFDTGRRDADEHRREIERFEREIAGDPITFRAATYQDVFGALCESDEPVAGWYSYMARRYFTRSGSDEPVLR